MKPTRPALRYFGGKFRLAPWIISHFPYHVCYVEPFCGAASVFLLKAPAEFEVINDIDGNVVNFFRVLRERKEEFIAAILMTPYSREEFDLAWYPATDPLERARRYYIRSWQGWGGKGTVEQHPGWRYQHSNNRGKSVIKDWNATEHLHAITARLKRVMIENDDVLNVIKRYDTPNTLFLLDPPYLPDTRSARWRAASYKHEMTPKQHRQLLDVLLEIEGMAIISGYPSELYEKKLAGWRRVQTTARTTNTSNTKIEVAWVSPAAVKNSRQQLLF